MAATISPQMTIDDRELATAAYLAALAALAGQLVAVLRADGSDDPLSERLTLACVLHDLFTLAGVRPPSELRERVG